MSLSFYRSKKKEKIQRVSLPQAPQRVKSGVEASWVWRPMCSCLCEVFIYFQGVRLKLWVMVVVAYGTCEHRSVYMKVTK